MYLLDFVIKRQNPVSSQFSHFCYIKWSFLLQIENYIFGAKPKADDKIFLHLFIFDRAGSGFANWFRPASQNTPSLLTNENPFCLALRAKHSHRKRSIAGYIRANSALFNQRINCCHSPRSVTSHSFSLSLRTALHVLSK